METVVEISSSSREKLRQWYSDELIGQARFVRRTWIGSLFGVFNQAAVTINGKVHLTPKAPDDLEDAYGVSLVGHELFHVEQQYVMGWIGFLVRYVSGWRPSHISDGGSHPLEAPAYRRGENIKRTLENM